MPISSSPSRERSCVQAEEAHNVPTVEHHLRRPRAPRAHHARDGEGPHGGAQVRSHCGTGHAGHTLQEGEWQAGDLGEGQQYCVNCVNNKYSNIQSKSSDSTPSLTKFTFWCVLLFPLMKQYISWSFSRNDSSDRGSEVRGQRSWALGRSYWGALFNWTNQSITSDQWVIVGCWHC